jgi:membrane peptidoglycan carboxypeptidase
MCAGSPSSKASSRVPANAKVGRIVAGGRTIIRQLVKILFLLPQRTRKRNSAEAATAIWFDLHLTEF